MSAYDTHLLEIFAGAVAVSLLLQSVVLLVIYRAAREVASRIDVLSKSLNKNVETFSEKMEQMLGNFRSMADGIRSLQENLTATSAIIHKRATELDAFVAEVTDIARLQVLRVQDVIDIASRRVEETIDLLRNGVLAPVTEAAAIIHGVKAGLNVFLGKQKKRPSSSTLQDEEMFI